MSEPRTKQSKACDICGNEFFRQRSHSVKQWEEIKCCSRKCGGELKKNRVLQTRPIKVCPTCKKQFKSQNGTYCSIGCYYAVRERPVQSCPVCKKEFKKPGSRQKHCSHKCSEIASRGTKPDRHKEKVKDGHGYTLVRVDDDSPFVSMRNKTGYIKEHRLILSQRLGRVLLQDETAHHKNGIRHDNRPDNLELRALKHGKGATVHCPTCSCNSKVETVYLKDFSLS